MKNVNDYQIAKVQPGIAYKSVVYKKNVYINNQVMKSPRLHSFAILFVNKRKNKIFNNTKSLLPDQHSLNMKILRASFVGYSMSSNMQPVYHALNPLDCS